MGVAVMVSCAFPTPIGRQNETHTLGHGDCRFEDD